MNKISVIIPIYNAEKTIKRCLYSILYQTKPVYEIIIVNDGSSDKSQEIVNEIKKDYENIKYYYKENSGVADTRNYGINKASGDYILFVDGDDTIELNLIEILENTLKIEQVELIKYKLKKVDINGNIIEKVEGPVFSKKTGEEAFNIMYYQDVLIDSPCVYLMKKELFTKNNFLFKGTYHEDFGLIPLVLVSAKSVVSIENYSYIYWQEENSITRNEDYKKTLKKMDCVLFQYDNMLKTLEKLELEEKTKQNIKSYYTNAIIIKLKELNKEDRKKYICKIKERKMFKNIKVKGLKQIIKRVLLNININLYLKLK